MSADEQQNINQILNLVELAEDNSPAQRKFLYQKIGNFLTNENNEFSFAEKELMADILCRITSDVEKSVRTHFSKNISNKQNIPPELIVFLANDDIEVALPILKDCGLMAEADLLDVIKTRSSQHQLAIAARDNIGEIISKALCETDNEEICVCLLNNHTAAISETDLEIFANKSETITSYQKPLLQRPFLPPKLAEKMYRWVSLALREYIVREYDIDPKILEISQTERDETIVSISKENDPSEKLVEKLHNAGELSNGFLLKSLRQGEIDLFEIAFAKLLELDRATVQGILYSKDPQILAVACRILEFDRVVFSTILDLTLSVNHKDTPISMKDRENAVGFYSLLKLDAAKRALANDQFLKGQIKYSQTN